MASKKKRLAERLEAATKSRDAVDAAADFGAPDDDEVLVELSAFVVASLVGLLVLMTFAIFFGTRTIESTHFN